MLRFQKKKKKKLDIVFFTNLKFHNKVMDFFFLVGFQGPIFKCLGRGGPRVIFLDLNVKRIENMYTIYDLKKKLGWGGAGTAP